MVMVVGAAPAVAERGRLMRERVDHSSVREAAERAVHGREAEARPALAETRVEILRGHVVCLRHQLGDDLDPLRRRTDAGRVQGSRCLPLDLRPGRALARACASRHRADTVPDA